MIASINKQREPVIEKNVYKSRWLGIQKFGTGMTWPLKLALKTRILDFFLYFGLFYGG